LLSDKQLQVKGGRGGAARGIPRVRRQRVEKGSVLQQLCKNLALFNRFLLGFCLVRLLIKYIACSLATATPKAAATSAASSRAKTNFSRHWEKYVATYVNISLILNVQQ